MSDVPRISVAGRIPVVRPVVRPIVRRLAIAGVACLAAGLTAGLAAGAPQEGQAPAGRATHGKSLYRVYCASCHGAEAAGDGKLAQYLTVVPADLRKIAARHGGEFPDERVRQVIDGRHDVRGHGGDMPVWGDVFQKLDMVEKQPAELREAEVAQHVDDLVAYLRSIQLAE